MVTLAGCVVLALLVAVLLNGWISRPDGSNEAGNEDALPWLATAGNRIVVAETQEDVVLRGANVLRSEWDLSMAAERVAFPIMAQEWNANVAVRGFASGPVAAQDEAYLQLLDEHVDLAREHAMYLVFAWRSHSVNGPQPSRPDEEAERALVALAERYHGQSHIAYALQVEPHDVTWDDVQPQFTSMTDAIRTAAAPHEPLVLVPGVDWSRDVSGAVAKPVDRPNVVYKTHPYNTAADFEKQFLSAHDAGLPVFIGEFGLLPELGMGMADVQALLDVAEVRGLGWAAWAMDYQGGPALVENNEDFQPTQPYGEAVRDALSVPVTAAG